MVVAPTAKTVALVVVIASWVLMLGILAVRHVRLRHPTAIRRTSSRVGLLLQALGYAAVLGVRPAGVSGPAAWPGTTAMVAAAAAVMTALGACVVVWSQQALGRQWSLTARLVADHRLVISGPYAYVRHPIYAAMILMLVGTGVVRTTPLVTGSALVLYLAGTLVRVRAEDALMKQAFGVDWDRYRRRVARLVPFTRW